MGSSRSPRPVKPPPNPPFQHTDRCRTPDAEPEWTDEGHGRWSRSCSCTVEHRLSVEPEPAAVVDVARHRHIPPDCTGTAVVKVDVNGERYTRCGDCETSMHVFEVDTAGMHPADAADYRAALIV